MPDDHDRAAPAAPTPQPDQEDTLAPGRARRETARAGGQRVGNNGPVANPQVSFPEAAGESDDDID